jgi:hypothetical protein
MTVLPAHKYGDPLQVLINKENAVENKLKGCKGCTHVTFDASGDRIYATCDRGRKVGRKGKCSIYRESE